MRNYQIYTYFLRDGVVLHDTGVGTVPNTKNFASTAKRCRQCDQNEQNLSFKYIALVTSYNQKEAKKVGPNLLISPPHPIVDKKI